MTKFTLPTNRPFFLLLLISTLWSPIVFSMTPAYSSPTASFSVAINHNTLPYRIFSTFVLPGENVAIEVDAVENQIPIHLESASGEQKTTSQNGWAWTAPMQPGLYPIHVIRNDSGETVLINAFVMRPFSEVKNGFLNGYHIGNYPVPASQIYQLPRGFIEVTAENENTLISPHFRLKQFLCKQSGTFPKYLVLKEPLLNKLERTLAEVNRGGYDYSGFHIMSGYRTPFYNQVLGNVRFSRHMLGEAADLLLDGAKTRAISAAKFFNLVDKGQRNSVGGGLGKYSSTRNHGPFVHVDVRPGLARWEG